jgi:outer membrane protein, heavy metal efflux system
MLFLTQVLRRSALPALLLLTFSGLGMAPPPTYASSGELVLEELIAEATKNNPELLMLEARFAVQQHRVPQAKSLPDPMLMFGYQNEGFKRITIGEEANAMGMFTLSQMFPFWGKRDLKEKMALREAQGTRAVAESARLKVASRVVDAYYDLFLAHKTIDILRVRADLYSQVESSAAARYASGMGPQQEVVMAQSEKYMLLEREEMQRQRLQALEGMLNTTVGREVDSPLGHPQERPIAPFTVTLDQALSAARSHSPELRVKEKMVQAAEAKVEMAKKEYYPDVTLAGSYFPKTKGLLDMWNLTATVNLPIFYRTKQREGVLEAQANLSEAKRDLKATDFMIASNVRENLSMVTAADRLMKLYTDALIPKTNQDVQLALSGYVAGEIEAMTVILRLKGLLDAELLYWTQYTERQKAIGRLHAVMGASETKTGENENRGEKEEHSAAGNPSILINHVKPDLAYPVNGR